MYSCIGSRRYVLMDSQAVLLAVDSDQARRTPRRVAREKQTAPLKPQGCGTQPFSPQKILRPMKRRLTTVMRISSTIEIAK